MRACVTIFFALILAATPMVPHARAADAQPSEYQLKAAYIFHFAQFVEWPATAFPDANSPMTIGILGDNPFGNDLEHTIQGKVLGTHALTVKEFRSVGEAATNCQILFICSSEKKRLPEILTGLKGTSILTVGEQEHFNEAGGIMINFVTESSKIHFQINQTVAEKAGLKISFKLLSLASHVTH